MAKLTLGMTKTLNMSKSFRNNKLVATCGKLLQVEFNLDVFDLDIKSIQQATEMSVVNDGGELEMTALKWVGSTGEIRYSRDGQECLTILTKSESDFLALSDEGYELLVRSIWTNTK
jgi:hypothetical protein